MARAATMAMVRREIADWMPIRVFNRAVRGIVSVGLKAVAAVKATKR